MAKLTINNSDGASLQVESHYRLLTLTMKKGVKETSMDFTLEGENFTRLLEMLLGLESTADFIAGWASRNRYDLEDILSEERNKYDTDSPF